MYKVFCKCLPQENLMICSTQESKTENKKKSIESIFLIYYFIFTEKKT